MSDIHTLSGAYVLDAVNDVERAAFARHLAECPSCAQEVAELTETAGRLADASATTPPAQLRGRVLEEIGRTRQLPPRPTQPARSARPWRRWAAAAVAAAVVLVAVGAGALVEEQRVRDAQRQSVQARAIEDVLSAPDAVLHTVAGPDGQGRVTVVVSQSRDQAVAVLGDLPAPGVDRAYQLWMIKDGQATDKGLLAAGATGGTKLIDGVRGEQRFAINNEPRQGSAAPTTPNPPVNFPLT
jgi:anti-sigma factor RsiW